MSIFVAFLVVLLLTVADGVGSAVMLMFTLLTGMLICMTLPQKQRSRGMNLLAMVFSIYVSVAYIASLSFSKSEFFYVSDSMRYIESYIKSKTFIYSQQDFYDCYFQFSDSNLLFNAYLNEMALIMNKYFGGMTVYGMTLCLTIFGVLSSLILYKIFLRHFNETYAYNQVLIFSLCSQFFLYSTVIVRDVVICFLYLVAFDIIDRKFSLKGFLMLFVVMLLAWGVRLYSGVFLGAFIWYYLYTKMSNGSARLVGKFLAILFGVIIAVAIIGSSLMEQTTEELEVYEGLSQARSAGGIASRLMKLPPGISHLCIVFYTMIRPLPPFSPFVGVESFSNFSIATLSFISGFFWFVCFYTYTFLAIFNHQLKKLDSNKLLLLGIVFLFLLANTAHPDVRRILPVFPVIYLLMNEAFIDPQNIKSVKKYKNALIVGFLTLGFVLLGF